MTSVYSDEWLPAGSYTASMMSPTAGTVTGPETSTSGGYFVAPFKEGTLIYSVRSSLSTGLPGVTVASGSTITIAGSGFDASSVVTADGLTLSTSSISPQQITAFLPALFSGSTPFTGLIPLEVHTSAGQSGINILVAPAGTPPALTISPQSLTFNYTVGGAALAAQGISITNTAGRFRGSPRPAPDGSGFRLRRARLRPRCSSR